MVPVPYAEMSTDSTSQRPRLIAELSVPPPGDLVVCSAVQLVVWISLACAAYNLAHFWALSTTARVVSILWPALIGVVAWLGVRDAGGVRRYLVNLLADFSLRHFVQAISGDDGVTVCLGYRLLGRDFHVLKINAAAIVSLDWRTGQATAMMGRDMGDWHVALWYDPPGQARRAPPIPGGRREHVVVVGQPQSKREAEAFGRSLIELFRSAGIEMIPGAGETEFRARSRFARTNAWSAWSPNARERWNPRSGDTRWPSRNCRDPCRKRRFC